MYPNLFFVEKWLEELAEEVSHLASPQPAFLKNAPYGYREVHYYDREHFEHEFYVVQYGELAKSVLSKLDTFRDKELITNLSEELRAGQFDDKQAYLNKYVGKVAGIFSDLWMAGMDFIEVCDNVIPSSITDVELYDDGVKYFYENEELELGNILYRIRSFFKYSGYGYKANPDEYTIESVLDKYATTSDKDDDNIKQKAAATETTSKLQWKGDKTDLAELIWALQKSERITDTTTGKPVTQKDLVNQLIALLGIDALDVANLMKYKYGTKSKPTSYKAKDGKTFPAELQKLLSSRILD